MYLGRIYTNAEIWVICTWISFHELRGASPRPCGSRAVPQLVLSDNESSRCGCSPKAHNTDTDAPLWWQIDKQTPMCACAWFAYNERPGNE